LSFNQKEHNYHIIGDVDNEKLQKEISKKEEEHMSFLNKKYSASLLKMKFFNIITCDNTSK